jgi:hypothetical protein
MCACKVCERVNVHVCVHVCVHGTVRVNLHDIRSSPHCFHRVSKYDAPAPINLTRSNTAITTTIINTINTINTTNNTNNTLLRSLLGFFSLGLRSFGTLIRGFWSLALACFLLLGYRGRGVLLLKGGRA